MDWNIIIPFGIIIICLVILAVCKATKRGAPDKEEEGEELNFDGTNHQVEGKESYISIHNQKGKIIGYIRGSDDE